MIVQNAASCNGCGDFIVSKHRHDFVSCTCGAISVDGGQAYLRRIGSLEKGSYNDHSWSLPDKLYNDCAEAVEEAMDTGRNKFGIANAVMRKLREAGRVIGEDEPRILAENKNIDEIMVEEADGTINRYKKVVE
jgi:hypothetical protein